MERNREKEKVTHVICGIKHIVYVVRRRTVAGPGVMVGCVLSLDSQDLRVRARA